MKFCINCGAKLDDDAKFCTECGAKCLFLEDIQVEEVEKEPVKEKVTPGLLPRFCVHCGTPLVGGEKFCTNCGKQLVKDLNNVVKTPAPQEERVEEKPVVKEEQVVNKVEEKQPVQEEPVLENKPQETTSFFGKVKFFLLNPHLLPNHLIMGITCLASLILFMILLSFNGFPWWMIFFLLIFLGSLFEVILSIIKSPSIDGSNNFFKKIPGWIGIKQGKSNMVKKIISAVLSTSAIITLVSFLFSSAILKFANFVAITPNTDYVLLAEDWKEGAFMNPSGIEVLTFEVGNRFTLNSNWSGGYNNTDNYIAKGTYVRVSTTITFTITEANQEGYSMSFGTGKIAIMMIDSAKTLKSGLSEFKKQ